jgi:putative peptidoglycan lipid II flippase
LAYGTSQVMVRLFNAQKDTRTPAWVGVGSIIMSAAGNWIFMQQWGHWGIALVTSLVSYVNTLVLYAIFRRRHGPLHEKELGRRFLIHFCLALTLGVILFVAGRPLATTSDSLMSPFRLLQFAAVLTVGVGSYLVLGYVCKVEEVITLSRKVMRK